jgi:hypothetical protein
VLETLVDVLGHELQRVLGRVERHLLAAREDFVAAVQRERSGRGTNLRIWYGRVGS